MSRDERIFFEKPSKDVGGVRTHPDGGKTSTRGGNVRWRLTSCEYEHLTDNLGVIRRDIGKGES